MRGCFFPFYPLNREKKREVIQDWGRKNTLIEQAFTTESQEQTRVFAVFFKGKMLFKKFFFVILIFHLSFYTLFSHSPFYFLSSFFPPIFSHAVFFVTTASFSIFFISYFYLYSFFSAFLAFIKLKMNIATWQVTTQRKENKVS